MPSLVIWRWVLLRLLRSAPFGVMALALLAGLPILQSLSPLPTSGGAEDLALGWAYPAALVGVAMGLVTLSHSSAFLDRLAPGTRLIGEGGALVGAGFYLQLPLLGGALLGGLDFADLRHCLLPILVCALHMGSVALLLLIPPFSTALRSSLFLLAVWLVPALASADQQLVRLTAFLDARPVLSLAPGAVPLAFCSAVGLVAAASLMRTSPARQSPR